MHRPEPGVKTSGGGQLTKRQEQGDVTRQALIAAARALFAERGFGATATQDVVDRAGVSRGPLYYHFKDKTKLFRAVFIELEKELNDFVIAAAAGHGDLLSTFRAGSRAALEFALRPDYRQIVIIDGPAVLGLPDWYALDSELGSATMGFGVQMLVQGNLIEAGSARRLATLLFGALNQATMEIAMADDPELAKEELLAEFDRLLDGLRSSRSDDPVGG